MCGPDGVRGRDTVVSPDPTGFEAIRAQEAPGLGPEERRSLVRWTLLLAFSLGTAESIKALVAARIQGIDFGVGRALAANMSWWLLWVPFALAVFWLAGRIPYGGHRLRAVGLHFAACTVLSLTHLAVSSVIIRRVALLPPGATNTIAGQFGHLVAGYLLMEFVIYGTALAGYGIVASRTRVRRADTERVRLALAASRARADRAHLESLVASAQLRALRSELDPHFLFNSLNSISALAKRGDAEGTVRMISRLGDLLRITMDERREDEVTVKDEIELVRIYLDIEEVRFGDRLSTRIHVDPAARDGRVPTLLLQPLVENAIRHAVSKVQRPVTVEVEAQAVDGTLRLVVRDSGPGCEGMAVDGDGSGRGGLGLRNVRERLRAVGGGASLTLRARPEGGTEAVAVLPLRLPESAEVMG